MKPSQKIDAANPALTVVSERSRSPNDLLNRALAHINYRHFDIGRLTIFEDPAIVVLNLGTYPLDTCKAICYIIEHDDSY